MKTNDAIERAMALMNLGPVNALSSSEIVDLEKEIESSGNEAPMVHRPEEVSDFDRFHAWRS